MFHPDHHQNDPEEAKDATEAFKIINKAYHTLIEPEQHSDLSNEVIAELQTIQKFIRENNYAEAIKFLTRLQSQYPESVSLLNTLAEVYFLNNNIGRALGCFKEILHHPLSTAEQKESANLHCAMIYFTYVQNPRTALAFATTAASFNCNNINKAKAYRTMALCHLELEDYDEYLYHIQQTIEFLEYCDQDETEVEYKQILNSIQHTFVDLNENLQTLKAKVSNRNYIRVQAIIINKITVQERIIAALNVRATSIIEICNQKIGECNAIQYFQSLTNIRKDIAIEASENEDSHQSLCLDTYLTRGISSFKLHQYDQSLNHMHNALDTEITPYEKFVALTTIVNIYMYRKNYQEIIIPLQELSDMPQISRNRRSQINKYLGICYMKIDDYQTAKYYFEKVVQLNVNKKDVKMALQHLESIKYANQQCIIC